MREKWLRDDWNCKWLKTERMIKGDDWKAKEKLMMEMMKKLDQNDDLKKFQQQQI